MRIQIERVAGRYRAYCKKTGIMAVSNNLEDLRRIVREQAAELAELSFDLALEDAANGVRNR